MFKENVRISAENSRDITAIPNPVVIYQKKKKKKNFGGKYFSIVWVSSQSSFPLCPSLLA